MKWADAITHRGEEAATFLADYFAQAGRCVLIIAAAGFDPRSTQVSSAIGQVAQNCRGIFIREERADPLPGLVERAESNVAVLTHAIAQSQVVEVQIFDPHDSAVVGAKRLLSTLAPMFDQGQPPTDIVIDLSALSIGISFPLVKYVFERYGNSIEVHLLTAEDVELDTGIVPEHADQAMYITGFDGGARLDEKAGCTRLWVPQLVANRQGALRRIHQFLAVEEICPILPFPAKRLRRADELLEAFIGELTDTWDVHPRNYLYASESDPLDLYRILLRLDDARKKVYVGHGGSMIILSPVGSKILAIGALLAALERNFPVAYLESVSYDLSPTAAPPPNAIWPVVHVWLSGAAYA